ncbi:MAG: thrombospondin type 3 repeat-containing protein [Bacillota bacterium]
MHTRTHEFLMAYSVRATIFLSTVAYSTRTIGIIVASVIAVGCIIVAVLISGPLPFHLPRAGAESTHDLLVSYAAKDTDGDSLPDWEEALYGTDPGNPHSVNATTTDGEAVAQGLVRPRFASATSTPTSSAPGVTAAPETITDQFARTLFAQYLSQRGNTSPTPDEIQKFVTGAIEDLAASRSHPDTYLASQVQVTGSGPEALRVYAAAVENVFVTYTVPMDQPEEMYFADAINKSDDVSLAKVVAIGNSYAQISRGIMKIPVPQELAAAHLKLANALMHVSESVADMGTFKTDPVRAMLGLYDHEQFAASAVQALSTMNGVFKAESVVLSAGESGSSFYQSTVEAATP